MDIYDVEVKTELSLFKLKFNIKKNISYALM